LSEQEVICIRSNPACNQETHNAVRLNLPVRWPVCLWMGSARSVRVIAKTEVVA